MIGHETNVSNPLAEGIKVVGIGKHGSKNLTDKLIQEIIAYLKTGQANPLQLGAFIGALAAKGIATPEFALENYLGQGVLSQPEQALEVICPDLDPSMREIGIKLLSRETLGVEDARKLGDFLFSDQPGESFRGMAASILRIRYESDEEYQGLIEAAKNTFAPGFRQSVIHDKTIVQLAEPFDGVEHSYMITPILAHALQKKGYIVVSTVSETAGPKYALNLLAVYQALGGSLLKQGKDINTDAVPALGWVLNQQDLSPAIHAWINRRRTIIKRPFLATMEKVLNPLQAKILITSIFHIAYMEKMVELADLNGFDGVIVLKRGLEGTLAPSIARASGILCAARQADGSFAMQEINAEEFVHLRGEADAVIEGVSARQNADLVEQYLAKGDSGDEDFNLRAGLAIELYSAGLQWIEGNWRN